MEIIFLDEPSTLPLSLGEVKSFLRCKSADEEVLKNLIKTATHWLEQKIERNLITRKMQAIHRNNQFILPFGPVQKILKVVYQKKEIQESEFELENCNGSTKIIVPFRWKSPVLDVTYLSGFGENSNKIPETIKQALMLTVEFLFESGNDFTTLERQVLPWLSSYKNYRLS
ncbi:MAG: hypothetical protein BGO07_01295 [Alphaproteobacteria bacterium 40-19]|nr:MAG: hypothetical protein BGO07_01295 [Alphaproteobacteria bacterium 40-19]